MKQDLKNETDRSNSRLRTGTILILNVLLIMVLPIQAFALPDQPENEKPTTISEPIKTNINIGAEHEMLQQVEVTGTITDAETGEPLPGVNIMVEGTYRGTISDVDGDYSIEVSPNASLVFSFVGYKTVTIPVGDQRVINVAMEAEVTELAEVVTVGYGKQSRITTTGAISSVQGVEIEKISMPTLGEALSGKIPGLQTIQQAGTPGASDPNIFLRGLGTLNNNEPLFVIDGVPSTKRTFMQLNPSSISDISVLKDASSTAVYGIKGANGVIIVSTKRGQTGKISIDADVSYGTQVATNLLEYTNSYQWTQAYNQTMINDGDSAGMIPQPIVDKFRTGEEPLLFTDHDWVEEFIGNAAREIKANVNITGGTDNVRYYTSLGYFKQGGFLEESDIYNWSNFNYNRFTLQTNLDIDLTPTTELNFTSRSRIGIRKNPNISDSQFVLWRFLYESPPMAAVGFVDDRFVQLDDRYLPMVWKNSMPSLLAGSGGYNETRENRIDVNLDLTQDLSVLSPILKGLDFRTKISYRVGFNQYKDQNGPYEAVYKSLYNIDAVSPNPSLGDSAIVLSRIQAPSPASYSKSYSANRYIYWEAALAYNRAFDDHTVGALFLYNQEMNYYPPGSWNYSNIPTGSAGLVGRVTYDYNKKYLIEFNLGYNGSENFAKDKRYGFFPSISAGWVLSNERFMDNLGFISYLKMRGSYGIVGSDQVGGSARFIYIGDRYNRDGPLYYGYNFGVRVPELLPGVREESIGNPDLTWETARKQNYGIDIKFFDGLIGINFDYFYEYRDDILMYRNTAPLWLAIELPPLNIGEVENQGFEVMTSLNGRSGDFTYNLAVNVGRAVNTILYMDEIPPAEPYQTMTGHPLGSPYGYVWEGFYSEEEVEQINYDRNNVEDPANYTYPIPTSAYVQPGDMKYRDLNGDNIINELDTKVIEYPNQPQVTGGINANFGYKGFDLTLGFHGVTEVTRSLGYSLGDYFGATNNRSLFLPHYENSWTPERAAEGTAEWPRLTFVNKQYNQQPSTFWVRDGSYLRLRHAELGYTFQRGVISRIGIEGIRIYLRGNNLFTWKKDEMKWIDPERQPNNLTYPLIKTYTVGLKVNF